MSNPISGQLMRATLAAFESQRQAALATIELYLNASVGIGDHPNIVAELVKATQQLSDAEESIETLQRNFLRTEAEEEADAE